MNVDTPGCISSQHMETTTMNRIDQRWELTEDIRRITNIINIYCDDYHDPPFEDVEDLKNRIINGLICFYENNPQE